MNIYVCRTCGKHLSGLIDALNGPHLGAPAAITIGDARVFFLPPTPELERHEQAHSDQCARYCPRWLRWAPKPVRVWAGTPKFLRVYNAFHQEYGYENNPLELEARVAEQVPL